MSDQQSQKLVEEAAEIRRRYASETNAEYRAQLTARYYQIEAELKALKTSAPATRSEAQSKGATQKVDASAPTDASEPFGIRMGMPIGQLGIGMSDMGNRNYALDSVPKPHPFFEIFIAETSPDLRVTGISAFGEIIPVNRYGSELRSQFQLMLSKLERIYGKPSRIVDDVNEDSTWSAPEYWMVAMVEGDRWFSAEWTDGARVPRDLKRIWLHACANSEEEGQVILSYESVEYVFEGQVILSEDDEAL